MDDLVDVSIFAGDAELCHRSGGLSKALLMWTPQCSSIKRRLCEIEGHIRSKIIVMDDIGSRVEILFVNKGTLK